MSLVPSSCLPPSSHRAPQTSLHQTLGWGRAQPAWTPGQLKEQAGEGQAYVNKGKFMQ